MMNTTAYEQRILRAIQEEWRCPICALLEEEEFDFLADLQYSLSNDEHVRNAFAHEGGFCDNHFRQFRRMASIATNALVLLALVDAHCGTNVPVKLKCRICERLASSEHTLERVLLNLFATHAFRELYGRACGLCLPHRSAVDLHQIYPGLAPWLDEVHRRQIQRFRPVLRELSSRSFFETTNAERNSIVQLVEKFVGRRAVGV